MQVKSLNIFQQPTQSMHSKSMYAIKKVMPYTKVPASRPRSLALDSFHNILEGVKALGSRQCIQGVDLGEHVVGHA